MANIRDIPAERGYRAVIVRIATPMAMTAGIPSAPTGRRLARIAFAALFIASAGPASTWAADDPTRRAADDGPAAQSAVTAWPEPRIAWLADLQAMLESARAVALEIATSSASEASGPVRARRARQRLRPFSMNLYAGGDFVNQKTAYWCIPASTQTMMNMMDRGRPNRTTSLQARLYRVGDRLEEDGTFSDEPEPDRYRGMGISEWAGLLNRHDYGPYGLAGYKSLPNALRNAAIKMRRTGKPVGLVVWRGAHAWVMSGFSATADPAQTRDFRVTSVTVHDPWYPRVSPFWGRSRGPNARVSPRVLAQDFRPYGRPGRRNPSRDGRYMLVLPGLQPAPPEV